MKNLKGAFLFLLLTVPLLLAAAPGDLVPDFSAKNQEGKVIRLSDFKEKFVLIYFYPKDDTPGCTKEACSFRDEYSKIKKMNTVVLGVSRQDEKSHQEFRVKHKLPFDLLVDSDGALAKSFGVGTMPLLGFVKRESILIGPNGRVIRFYEDVDPSTHVQEVIKDIEKATHAGPQATGLRVALDREAQECSDLKCVRLRIDRINDQMISLLGQRTALVRRAGEIKGPHRSAMDQKRVDEEIEVISKKSEEAGVPKEIGPDVFKMIIKNSVEYEQKYKDSLFNH